MKDVYPGSTYVRGRSLIEIVIAFGVLLLVLSATVMVAFGNQSITVDTETSSEALYRAHAMLEKARADSRTDYISLSSSTSTESIGSMSYGKLLTVTDLTQCKKQATSSVLWNTGTLRPQHIDLSTRFVDVAGVLALGGDCATEPPSSNWDNPQRFASDTFNPGKPMALDVFRRLVYLGIDKSPFLYVTDTRSAVQGQTSGMIVPYTNGFDLGVPPNDLDVIHVPSTGKIILYAGMHANTNQVRVIDVTDMAQPVVVATRTLATVVSAGSYPQAREVYVYKDRLYVSTWETAGREFHVFDISSSTAPTEIGTGRELGITVEDFVVRDQYVAGVLRRLAFMATDKNDGELMVYDVTDPLAATELPALRQNLPGNQDGMSVFVSGARLYFGRASTPSGPELYVYDVTRPDVGLTLLGSRDIGTGVLAIRVEGRFGFIVTPATNREFQVWNVSDPGNIMLIERYNFGNLVSNGLDYEPDFIYTTGDATPNFQILYSPPNP